MTSSAAYRARVIVRVNAQVRTRVRASTVALAAWIGFIDMIFSGEIMRKKSVSFMTSNAL